MKKNNWLWISAVLAISGVLFFSISWSRHGRAIQTETTETVNQDVPGPEGETTAGPDGLRISAVAAYKNLEVYVLYGNTELDNKKYVVLKDALDRKLVRVRETGEVNELKIDNNSKEYIYINSGDIVHGGRQDRTIQYDVIIPPGKKNVDIASFCVEHGRWQQRGAEDASGFASSNNSLSSKELKVAAKYANSQQQVWDKVDKYQNKANENYNRSYAVTTGAPVNVKSGVSETSLELTLNNETVKKTRQTFKQHLLDQIKDRKNAVGFAYFINGKLYSVDVFNNHQLFADLFDKLLDASIAEAISEDSAANKTSSGAERIKKLLGANTTIGAKTDVNEATQFNTAETASEKDLVLFTTTDKQLKKWLHHNWLDKTEN
jgi:hypothetical protein